MSDIQPITKDLGGLRFMFRGSNSNPAKGDLTAILDGKILLAANLDIGKLSLRKSFLKEMIENNPSIKATLPPMPEMSRCLSEMYVIADTQRPKSSGEHKGDGPGTLSAEVDCSNVTRPSLFHLPGISGLLVPVTVPKDDGGGVQGAWRLYIQRGDKRECLILDIRLDLDEEHPGKSLLWFQPIPGEPAPGTQSRWSQEGRTLWLGGYTPDPKALYERLYQCFDYFLEFPPQDKEGILATLSLWTMLTYIYPVFEAIPYVSIGGLVGSGKTKVFGVLDNAVLMPISTENITSACMFRKLDASGGVLLYDEAERLKAKTPEALAELGLLNAGYKKGGMAYRLEPVGDSYAPKGYSVYGPKAIAGISSLPPTLASRSIRIMMFKAGKGSERTRRSLKSKAKVFSALSDDLHAFALSYGHKFIDMGEDMSLCAGIYDRALELWQPLLALAGFLERECGVNGLGAIMKAHAVRTIKENSVNVISEIEEIVLSIFVDSIPRNGDGSFLKGGEPKVLTAGDILMRAKIKDENLFRFYSAKGIGTILGRYGLVSKHVARGNEFRTSTKQLRNFQELYGFMWGLGND